ncbi:MAG TPA: amidase [Thermoleophilaceae bacterium]|jgi:Asp-tRNA(Asn)/Glu-tRNA(Gln) amidotransferase A subunit family amidase|nr:amidase [Thermoleophilaceae bacterium]
MSHPQDLPLRDQAAGISSGELDPAELLDATLARIEERNRRLNAVVATFREDSQTMLEQAPDGPLRGVPVAVKDQFQIPFRAPRDGTEQEMAPAGESGIFRRLRDAGAVVVAVTNMHYLGGGSTGVLSAYGPVGNPWNPDHVGGGSSGGSACSVGARMVAGSVGADGGGSIRLPAGYCGVTGIKPTFGAVPVDGNIHGYMDLDALGPFGRDSDDARLLLEALMATELAPGDGSGLKVGIPRFFWGDVDPSVEEACSAALEAAGWPQREIDIDGQEHSRIATGLYLALQGAPEWPASVLEQADPVSRAYGKFALVLPANALMRAQRVRSQVRRSVARIFEDVDLLALPTVPAAAPPIENPTVTLPSGDHPADHANVRQTGVGNLTGLPGINVPAGFDPRGLPIGLQLLAPWGAEARLLDAAKHIEQATSREFVDAVPQAYL